MTNTTGSLEAPLLKTDVLGRMRTPAARREQLLDEFERSGASGVQFAKLTGLKYQTLATWVLQRKRRRVAISNGKNPNASVAKVRWLEATVGKVADHDGTSTLPVQLPGGAGLEISCAKQIPLAAALLRALEKAASC
jgi:hypothetical protein